VSTNPAPVRRHRLRTALLVTAGVFVVYLVIGLLYGPTWARQRIERAFAENTYGTLSLGKVGVNPLKLSATLHDVHIAGPAGDSLFSVAALTVDFSVRSWFQRAAVFDHVLIDSPALWLVVGRDSTLHWAHLLKATAADTSKKAAAIPRVVVLHSGCAMDASCSRTAPSARPTLPRSGRSRSSCASSARCRPSGARTWSTRRSRAAAR
jgi:hypothetical protein